MTEAGEPQLARQGAVYLVARAVQVVAYVVVMPVVTRQLTQAEYGTVSLALVTYQALAAVASLGLASVVAWAIYERRPDAEVEAQRMLVSTSLIAAGVVALALGTGPWWSQLFSEIGFGAPLQLAVWLVFPITVQAAALSILQAQGRPVAFAVSTILSVVGGQCLGLLLLSFDATPQAYLAGILGGAVVGAIAAVAAIPLRHLRPAGRAALVPALRHGGPTVPHLLGFMVVALADRVLVERILGLEAAARYQAAYVVGSIGAVVLYGLNNAWGPMVYADREPGWRVLVSTTRTMAWVFGLGVAAVSLAAPIGLRIVAPASYGPADLSTTATLVMAATMFDLAYLAAVHVLFTRKRTGALLWIMPVAGAVNVVANLVLLERWGLEGAGFATLVGYVVMAVAAGWASRRVAHVPWDLAAMAVPLAIAAAGVTLALVLPAEGAALVVRVVLAAAALAPIAVGAVRYRRTG